MTTKEKIIDSVLTTKHCAFCNSVFHSVSHSARYCTEKCKQEFFKEKKKNQKWYDIDPNRGKSFPLGTITSWEIPEEYLVTECDINTLLGNLLDYLHPNQLIEERHFILDLKPYSEEGDWFKSSVQIFTNNYFMEVLRAYPERYKLYVKPWESDDEKPFSGLI